MRRVLTYAAAAALVAGGLAGQRPARAQQDAMHSMHGASHAAAEPAKTAAGGGASAAAVLRAAVTLQLDGAQKELISLAEAMPADKYAWRPGEGVRSVGEVYMHVATANYFLPTFWGIKVPAGIDLRGLEKEGADKAKTVATLKQSFDYFRQAMDGLSDADLGKPIDFFGHKTTAAYAMLQAVFHAREHLGQSIAYARVNGVVPPWSAAQGQGGQSPPKPN
jgi:uncharacterized damage-inducible protein DinB